MSFNELYMEFKQEIIDRFQKDPEKTYFIEIKDRSIEVIIVSTDGYQLLWTVWNLSKDTMKSDGIYIKVNETTNTYVCFIRTSSIKRWIKEIEEFNRIKDKIDCVFWRLGNICANQNYSFQCDHQGKKSKCRVGKCQLITKSDYDNFKEMNGFELKKPKFITDSNIENNKNQNRPVKSSNINKKKSKKNLKKISKGQKTLF